MNNLDKKIEKILVWHNCGIPGVRIGDGEAIKQIKHLILSKVLKVIPNENRGCIEEIKKLLK